MLYSQVTNRHGVNLRVSEDRSADARSYPCFCLFSNLVDARGRHQKKIRSKTQNYLNLYAAEGLRTLCIAKRVSGGGPVRVPVQVGAPQ